jgi:hypothetical protein
MEYAGKTVREWAEELGVSAQAIRHRCRVHGDPRCGRVERASMKELGAQFNLPANVVGGILKQAGLRTAGGRPSSKAYEDGYVMSRRSAGVKARFPRWDREKTSAVLQEALLRRERLLCAAQNLREGREAIVIAV